MKQTKSRDKLHKEKITFNGSSENVNGTSTSEKAEFSFVQGRQPTDQITDENQRLTDEKGSNLDKGNSTQKIVIPQGKALDEETSSQQAISELHSRPKSTLVNSKLQTKEHWFDKSNEGKGKEAILTQDHSIDSVPIQPNQKLTGVSEGYVKTQSSQGEIVQTLNQQEVTQMSLPEEDLTKKLTTIAQETKEASVDGKEDEQFKHHSVGTVKIQEQERLISVRSSVIPTESVVQQDHSSRFKSQSKCEQQPSFLEDGSVHTNLEGTSDEVQIMIQKGVYPRKQIVIKKNKHVSKGTARVSRDVGVASYIEEETNSYYTNTRGSQRANTGRTLPYNSTLFKCPSFQHQRSNIHKARSRASMDEKRYRSQQTSKVDGKKILDNMRLLHEILAKDGEDNLGKQVYMPIPNHNFVQNQRICHSTNALAKADAYQIKSKHRLRKNSHNRNIVSKSRPCIAPSSVGAQMRNDYKKMQKAQIQILKQMAIQDEEFTRTQGTQRGLESIDESMQTNETKVVINRQEFTGNGAYSIEDKFQDMPLNRIVTDEQTLRQQSGENPPGPVVNIPVAGDKDTEDFTLALNSGATTGTGQRNKGLVNPQVLFMGSGDLSIDNTLQAHQESMGSTVYQEQIKIQDGGVDKPETPPSVMNMNVGRSDLLTKMSEQDQKDSHGLKTKTSNADLLPILPDYTRNENRTQTEDTAEKKFKDEIKIDAPIQLLEQSISDIEKDDTVDPNLIIKGFEENPVEVETQHVLKLGKLKSELEDQKTRKSVKVVKKTENEDTTLTEQSKIGDPTSPNTIRSPYLKSSYNEISTVKKQPVDSNAQIETRPQGKKTKSGQSRDSKSIDHKRRSSTRVESVAVKEQAIFKRGSQESQIQKNSTVHNISSQNINVKTVIPLSKPAFGSSQNDTSAIYGSSMMNEQTLTHFATFNNEANDSKARNKKVSEPLKQAVSGLDKPHIIPQTRNELVSDSPETSIRLTKSPLKISAENVESTINRSSEMVSQELILQSLVLTQEIPQEGLLQDSTLSQIKPIKDLSVHNKPSTASHEGNSRKLSRKQIAHLRSSTNVVKAPPSSKMHNRIASTAKSGTRSYGKLVNKIASCPPADTPGTILLASDGLNSPIQAVESQLAQEPPLNIRQFQTTQSTTAYQERIPPQEQSAKMFVLKFNDMRTAGLHNGKGLSVMGKQMAQNQKSVETIFQNKGIPQKQLEIGPIQHSRYASNMWTSEVSVSNFPVKFDSSKRSTQPVSRGTLKLTLSKGGSLTQSCNNFLQKTERDLQQQQQNQDYQRFKPQENIQLKVFKGSPNLKKQLSQKRLPRRPVTKHTMLRDTGTSKHFILSSTSSLTNLKDDLSPDRLAEQQRTLKRGDFNMTKTNPYNLTSATLLYSEPYQTQQYLNNGYMSRTQGQLMATDEKRTVGQINKFSELSTNNLSPTIDMGIARHSVPLKIPERKNANQYQTMNGGDMRRNSLYNSGVKVRGTLGGTKEGWEPGKTIV